MDLPDFEDFLQFHLVPGQKANHDYSDWGVIISATDAIVEPPVTAIVFFPCRLSFMHVTQALPSSFLTHG